MISFEIDEMWQRNLNEMLEMLESFKDASEPSTAKEAEIAMAAEAALYAAEITPWQSGALATSHVVVSTSDETYVHINPTAVNPSSDEDPPEYGPKVHKMGEDHAGTPLAESPSGGARAFYTMTVELFGEELLNVGEETFIASLEVFS